MNDSVKKPKQKIILWARSVSTLNLRHRTDLLLISGFARYLDLIQWWNIFLVYMTHQPSSENPGSYRNVWVGRGYRLLGCCCSKLEEVKIYYNYHGLPRQRIRNSNLYNFTMVSLRNVLNEFFVLITLPFLCMKHRFINWAVIHQLV